MYKVQHFSSPSDLMKSSCWMDESLSSTTNVLFQRIYQLLNDTTEWEIYTKSRLDISGNKSSDQKINDDELADAEIYSMVDDIWA